MCVIGDQLRDKADTVYRDLKTRILNGVFKPGQLLSINRIAKESGVARSVVCGSLARLRAEGLVRNEGAYARTYVERRDLPLVVEHYEVREVIEGAAARLAAQSMNVWQVAELRRLATCVLESKDNLEAATQANIAFHRYLVEKCGNSLLTKIYDAHHLAPVSVASSSSFDKPLDGFQNRIDAAFFTALCDAITARDGAAAEACIRKDLRQITGKLRSAVSSATIPSAALETGEEEHDSKIEAD